MNNWAQVCIKLTKDAQGNMGYTATANCQPYIDCMGTLYGNAVVDCEGDCGGSALRGDVDLNQLIETNDGDGYVNGIVNSSIAVSPCKDISDDGIISVWDAGLAINCALNGGPNNNNCEFPNTIQSISQYAEIGYTEINTSLGYIDVYLRNPDCKIVGYEFNVSGIEISNVQSLISATEYPATPAFLPGGNKVVCISTQDSLISKHVTPTPLARIYYSQITDPTICVEQIIHVLNSNYEPIIMATPLNCISVAGVDELGMQEFSLYPNPAQNEVSISLKVKAEDNFDLIVLDAMGREMKKQIIFAGSIETNINISDLSNGIYQVVLTNGTTRAVKNLSVVR